MERIDINNFLLRNQLPSSTAIITPLKSLTYNDLARFSNGTKNYYSEKGITENSFTGIFCEHTAEFVISVVALWKIGAIPVLLNPKVTQNELEDFLQSANCKIIIGTKHQLNKYDITGQKVITLQDDLNESLDEENKREINPGKTAAIIFTSGSSAKPKGVKLSFNSFYQSGLIGNTILEHSINDRWLASLPFYHVGGFSILTRSLIFSVPIIIPGSVQTDELADSIVKFNPTLISLVSTLLKRLLDKKIKPNPELKNVLLGGGHISNYLVDQALKLGWKITKVYGSTETASFITALSLKDFKLKPESAGKPISPNKIKIINENKNELPKNSSGEILINSPSLMQGYLNNDDESNNIIDEYFRSNDIGYIDDDGYLFLVGRKSETIISGGENINILEVEKEFLEHPDIQETAVFPLKSKEWGEIVCAAIVIKKLADNFNIDELKSYLINKLTGFKIPKKIFIVKELPKTTLGKISRSKLVKRYKGT